MSLIISEGREVSLHKHPTGTSAHFLLALMEPLKKMLGIEVFSYGKLFASGDQSYLTTNPGYTEDFYNNRFYRIGLLDDPKNYKPGYYLSDLFRPTEASALLRERYGFAHFLVIIRQHEHYCERFFFGTSDDNTGMTSIYLNQRHTFDAFSDYFKEQASAVIEEADSSRIICPSEDCHETVLMPHSKVVDSLDFLSATTLLTLKEKECATYLAQCLSLKEVAAKMAISPRTLEKHIAHLKAKLGCHNLTSLVVKLRGVHEFYY